MQFLCKVTAARIGQQTEQKEHQVTQLMYPCAHSSFSYTGSSNQPQHTGAVTHWTKKLDDLQVNSCIHPSTASVLVTK